MRGNGVVYKGKVAKPKETHSHIEEVEKCLKENNIDFFSPRLETTAPDMSASKKASLNPEGIKLDWNESSR